MRQQGHPWRQAEAPDLLRRQQRDFGDLLGGRIGIDRGVADEQRMPRQHQQVHRGEVPGALLQADDIGDIAQMRGIGAGSAAQQPVRLALPHQRRPDQRRVPPHLRDRVVAGEATAAAKLVVDLRRFADHGVVVEVGDLEILARLNVQAQFTHLLLDHMGPADQDRARQVLVDHHLGRPQHPVVLALGVADPLA